MKLEDALVTRNLAAIGSIAYIPTMFTKFHKYSRMKLLQ